MKEYQLLEFTYVKVPAFDRIGYLTLLLVD